MKVFKKTCNVTKNTVITIGNNPEETIIPYYKIASTLKNGVENIYYCGS